MGNDEDMLDFYAGCVMVGDIAHRGNCGPYAEPNVLDARSASYYKQAQSMLRVRKEFLKDANDD